MSLPLSFPNARPFPLVLKQCVIELSELPRSSDRTSASLSSSAIALGANLNSSAVLMPSGMCIT